jgi:hypothetical protein
MKSRPIMKRSVEMYLSGLKWRYPLPLYVNGKENANILSVNFLL